MEIRRRLARHLSCANVIACLALFAALGGSAYAGSKINGNSIAKQSIGGGKLKNEPITSKQIKKGSLNSSVINVSSLTTVPSAQNAVSAQSAGSANTANSAKTADSAATANTATKATSSETATHATSADTATSAGHADTAGDADTVDGETAAELTDACPANTTLFGGMCWDDSPQPTVFWVLAAKECGDRGGRLPSVSELIAYVLQDGIQATEQTWSADVADVGPGDVEQVVTSDETKREVLGAGSANTASAASSTAPTPTDLV